MDSDSAAKIRAHNRAAWDRNVEQGNPWTIPVGPEAIEQARRGKPQLVLTPSKFIPDGWFPPLQGLGVLCLASGGGQQGPLLAAAGAEVTVLDNSPRQLEQDRLVAARENLKLKAVEADATDLSMFADGVFGMIVHPCSNCFIPGIRPVWRECFRVLRPGGVLMAGFVNPIRYLFDDEQMGSDALNVCCSIPYSDLRDLPDAEAQRKTRDKVPFEFGHTLEDQIAGQLDAGFVITGFYEDRYSNHAVDPLSVFIDSFIATRAVKPVL